MSPKRVSFSLPPGQQHDEERMASIKAFVPPQKLQMLRDRRAKAAAAARDARSQVERTVSSVSVSLPHGESSDATRLERIRELSKKLRLTELERHKARHERKEVVSEEDTDSVALTVSSATSLTPTRAVKAVTIAVGYLASALLRPQPT